MKPTRNLKNILSLFSVDLGSKFLGFFATTYLARILGTSGFGAINIGLAVLVYVQILSSSGLTLIGTKKIAEEVEDSAYLVGDIILIRFILTFIIVLLTFLVSLFFITSEEIRIIVLVYILYAFPAALLIDWFFAGKQKLEITSAGRISGSIVYLIFVFLLVKSSDDIINTAVAWVISGIANAAFIWYLFHRYGYKIKLKISRLKESVKLLRQSAPVGLASLLSQLAIMFPALYLGIVSGTSDVGIYSAAYRLIALFLIFDRVFVTVFFPKIVNSISLAPERLEEIFNRILKIISVLALIVSLFMVVSGEIMINIVFGDKFKDAVVVFQVLVGFFTFTLINSVLSYTLIAINREISYIIALSISLVAFIAAIILLYSGYLIIGIAVALIIYEVVQASIMIFKIRGSIPVSVFNSIVAPALVSLAVMLALINIDLHIAFKLLIAAFIGIPLISITGGVKFEDIRYLKRLMI